MRNCTLANQTYTSVEVKCIPGYDGGLPQKFLLEVYHGDVDFTTHKRPIYNVSTEDQPVFALMDLETSADYVHVAIYAVNSKGRSQPVIISEVTSRDAEKRTGELLFFSHISIIPIRKSLLTTIGFTTINHYQKFE